jgi:regulator of sirC expression with transglutaminase-like and TPR domain
VTPLERLLAANDPAVQLDEAAIGLAQIEFPALDPQLVLAELDAIADGLKLSPSESFARHAQQYFYEELGFQGNTDNYYDPLNSCLNSVLDRRIGIPISLSILYMEIGRRLGRPVYGVGLPGHFLVRVEEDGIIRFLDPFHRGQILTMDECLQLGRQASGIQLDSAAILFKAPSRQQIILRMLNNLRGIYSHRRAWSRAIAVMDLMILAGSDAADLYKQRAFFHTELKHYRKAASDLGRYLQLAPEAGDRTETEETLQRLRTLMAMMN